MISAPTVSVVVPNYNHARFLRQRLDTILAQTYQDFELILLDDCSTDESQSILSEYASDPHVAGRVRLECNKANSGSTFKQWNKGVRLANGKYVWIAESDDYADPRLLESLVCRLDAEPKAVLCYCRSWRVSAEGKLDGHWDSHLLHLDNRRWVADFSGHGIEECRRYLIHCNTVQSASSVLFRREQYWQAGGADEDFVLGGDWKTWASMALTGGIVQHVGESLNFCRFHGASVSEENKRNGVWALEAVRVIAWILDRVPLEQNERACAYKNLAPLWIPVVLDKRVPVARRCALLKNVMCVDPHAFRRLGRAVLTAARATIRRRWGSVRPPAAA